jgi:hypothetical protein
MVSQKPLKCHVRVVFFVLCPALSVLVWPLVVYHELIQRMYTGLEPILMKLDYSMKGDTQHHKHDKRSEFTVCVFVFGVCVPSAIHVTRCPLWL